METINMNNTLNLNNNKYLLTIVLGCMECWKMGFYTCVFDKYLILFTILVIVQQYETILVLQAQFSLIYA